MRYTSNDAPRGITFIAVRGVARSATGVYMRVRLRASYMRGQDAWPAGWPASGALLSLDLARSCSLLLARGRPLDAPLPSLEAPSDSALLERGRTVAASSAWHRRRGAARLPPCLSPRDLILITILLFLSSELQLRQLRKRRPPTRRFTFHPLLFHFVFFPLLLSVSLSVSLPVERRTLVLEIDEVAHCARGTQKTRVLIAIFNASHR